MYYLNVLQNLFTTFAKHIHYFCKYIQTLKEDGYMETREARSQTFLRRSDNVSVVGLQRKWVEAPENALKLLKEFLPQLAFSFHS